jgi:hypothetical protein
VRIKLDENVHRDVVEALRAAGRLVVLRLRNTASARQIDRIRTFLAEEPVGRGRLWIVEETRARDWTP